MCCDFIVQVSVEDDVSASVAPAAYVDRYADGGRMTGRILDIDAHDGIPAAHALGTKADGVDAVFQKLLHLCGSFVLVVGSDGTHQGLLGKKGCRLYGGGDAYADQKAAIMRAISEQAGPGTKAGAICFSLPISAVSGLRQRETEMD